MAFLEWQKFSIELLLVQFMSRLALRILKGNLGLALKALKDTTTHTLQTHEQASNLLTTCHPLLLALKVEAV
jgi:hypothetical protein